VIVDWIEAFIWAAFVVLLINQYFLQAYQIPSGSMRTTLIEGDRIFVNKLIYGPELLPGLIKLPGFERPERGEVVIFENPSYISKGPLFDIMQRVIYMVTLSLVDIDRTASGEPRAHFLIKRAVGVAGDRFRLEQGNMEIRPEGAAAWMSEEAFLQEAGFSYEPRRLVEPQAYVRLEEAAVRNAREDLGLPSRSSSEDGNSIGDGGQVDPYYLDWVRVRELFAARPHERRLAARYAFYDAGWYVPEGRIFPMGDNRDNSRDARSFGAVDMQNVLGRAMFRYWPVNRIGGIE
jgi:signal peptidase I